MTSDQRRPEWSDQAMAGVVRPHYKFNSYIFQAKRFNRKAFCALCQDRIWVFGRQGCKCIQCKILIHKQCHKLLRIPCDAAQVCTILYPKSCSLFSESCVLSNLSGNCEISSSYLTIFSFSLTTRLRASDARKTPATNITLPSKVCQKLENMRNSKCTASKYFWTRYLISLYL